MVTKSARSLCQIVSPAASLPPLASPPSSISAPVSAQGGSEGVRSGRCRPCDYWWAVRLVRRENIPALPASDWSIVRSLLPFDSRRTSELAFFW
eukprot:1195168-Prorocentrum_minimum.AAC.5